MEIITYIIFIINILIYRKKYDLRNKTVLYFICIVLTVLVECKMEKENSQSEHGQQI